MPHSRYQTPTFIILYITETALRGGFFRIFAGFDNHIYTASE